MPGNRRRYPLQQFLNVVDDDIDEDKQSFAEIGPDVPDRVSCFKIAEGETACFGTRGAIQIRIIDNDRKLK